MPKKRSSHCFVPGCNTQYKSNKLSLFCVPKTDELRQQWERLIPRADKNLDEYVAVCELHFDERFIQRNFVHVINGETVTIPRDRPVLTADAIPTNFPNLPKYLTKTVPKKRKLRDLNDVKSSFLEDTAEEGCEKISMGTLKDVKLPSKFWGSQVPDGESSCYIFHTVQVNNLMSLETHKLVILSEKDSKITCKAFVKGKEIKCVSYLTMKNLEDFLQEIDNLKICKGSGECSEFQSLKKLCQTCDYFENKIYSKRCKRSVICDDVCMHCKYLRRLLLHKLARHKRNKLKPNLKKLKRKCQLHALRKLVKQVDKLEFDLKTMAEKNSRLEEDIFMGKMQFLPLKQQDMLKHCFAAVKRKSTNGMSYSKDWILECILMNMKSPKLYEHIRQQEIMILPSKTTLRKYISQYNSGFGFNPNTFYLIKEKAKSMANFLKHGGLLIDEIKLTEKLHVSSSGRIDGFVDLGPYTPEEMKSTPSNHGLVIVFQPLTGNWKQIIGVFATSNNVNANILSKLIIEATVLTENSGLFVDFITCDGASWNRSMWKIFGISGQKNNVTCKVSHPVDCSRYLHFISDFPHLIKCLRNGFVSNGYLLPQGEARPEHIHAAWKIDSNDVTLKAMPTITTAHIYPNNFEKMRVNYAFQLFSLEVLKGLYLYKEDIEKRYHSINATYFFIKLIKDLKEAMTSRLPAHGLKTTSAAHEIIVTFLEYLDKWEASLCYSKAGFLSSSTAAGLRVTLNSTLSLLKYLKETEGFTFLMTSRLSQDSIENIFGIVRQSSGCNDHPTPTEFLITIQCLSFYSLAKPPKGGNCDPEVINSLIATEKPTTDGMKQVFLKLDELLDGGNVDDLENIANAHPISPLSSDNLNHSRNQLLIYIAGYVARKCVLQNKCHECRKLCFRSADEKITFSGTLISEFDNGGLIYPTPKLLVLVCQLEGIVTFYFSNNNLHEDSIHDVLSLVFQKKVQYVGCPEHEKYITCRITKFFLLTRMHFYVKGLNVKKKECRQKIKFLKLRRCN